MSRTIVMDIETCALPEPELVPFMPKFEAPGNFRDPEKIAEAIAAKRQAWIDDCALDPLTGRVLAIGMIIGPDFICLSEPATEAVMLNEFWDAVALEEGNRLIGFNINLFDLPFLVRRSWKLNAPIPINLRVGRYWSNNVIDLRDIWQCGDRQAKGSLDTIAKHFGLPGKTGEGKDFAKTWVTDRAKALEYLKSDVTTTLAVAKHMGVKNDPS